MRKVLVVDDEANVLSSFKKMLGSQGYDVITARRGDVVLSLLESERPDLVVMDIRMPGMNGLEVFRRAKEMHPKLPVIIMTGYGTADAAIEATKLGAFDYRLKPFDPDEMLRSIGDALESVRLMEEQVALGPGEPASTEQDAIIGRSAAMQNVYKAIGRVAQTDATILIRGETGTGKELVARAVYQHGTRSGKPMLMVNCVAIPETLLESELFGYEKGAFSGASARRIGKFEQAQGGTVLLDEIGDIPLSIQAKILRVLQDKTFERIGGNEAIRVDVRVLAATNRNLEKAISEGNFRQDLYHRLNVVTIDLPPLRDRREDIPPLVDYFLTRFADELDVERPILTSEALEILNNHPWPGNVRQLEHCIHRAMIFSRGYPIQPDNVKRALDRPGEEEPSGAAPLDRGGLSGFVREYLKSPPPSPHAALLEEVDRLLVLEALRLCKGNQTHAAKLLGITRPTLQAKMKKYNLRRETTVNEE